MQKIRTALIALTLVIASGAANAGMMYDVTSHSPGGHSFWLPGIGLSHLHFMPAGKLVVNGDGTATLTGTIKQGATVFDVDATMSGLTKADQALCNAAKYESGATNQNCLDHWSIFTGHLSGSLSVAGVEQYSFWSAGKPPPQFGTHKANAKNNHMGLSSWIYYTATNCGQEQSCAVRHGDINVNLKKVPEPATLGLIGLGLIGLFAARRRQRYTA